MNERMFRINLMTTNLSIDRHFMKYVSWWNILHFHLTLSVVHFRVRLVFVRGNLWIFVGASDTWLIFIWTNRFRFFVRTFFISILLIPSTIFHNCAIRSKFDWFQWLNAKFDYIKISKKINTLIYSNKFFKFHNIVFMLLFVLFYAFFLLFLRHLSPKNINFSRSKIARFGVMRHNVISSSTPNNEKWFNDTMTLQYNRF